MIGERGIAIIPAAKEVIRNNDVHYPFRQNSDFYYLTAYPEPDALAVIVPGHPDGEFILFNRERDPAMERWTGPRIGQDGACAEYGADRAYPISEINKILPKLLRQRMSVYYSFAHDERFDHQFNHWLQEIRTEVRKGVNAPWQIIDLDHYLHDMRLSKDATEIASMKKAGDISAQAHLAAMQKCQVGCYEYDLLAEINYVFQKHGCLNHAYDAIVGAGKNSCILHYINNQDRCADGDLVLIDAGVEYHHYAADITRTFPVNGKFTAEQAAIYDIVLDAQQQAIAMITPGVKWNALQQCVVEAISRGLIDLDLIKSSLDTCLEERLYRRFYMHNFGHWLGMDVHDVGTYKQNGDWRELAVGNVLTVEPGIYIAADETIDQKWWNIGVRIEDDVHVTAQGAELLAQVPKTREDIEAIMHG